MKKRRLMTPWLASVLFLSSVCMGTTVYADEPVTDDGIAIVEVSSPQEEGTASDEVDSSGTETVPKQDEEADSEQNPIDEEPSDEDTQDPEEDKEIVKVSVDVLYQGDETTLEADRFCDEETKDILREVFVITIPQELTAGKLTKPVFENAEVTVLIDGEEISTEEDVIDIGAKAEEIGINVKPIVDVVKQMQKLILTLVNDSAEESESTIETVLHRFFKDGSEESTEPLKLMVQLKGIRPVSKPDTGTDADEEPEPEIPEEQEPGSDEVPEEKQEEDEKKEESESEETKPQKNPVEQIIEIIDHSGLNLMESTASVQGNGNHSFSSSTASANDSFGLEWFHHEKIETASVEEADESFLDNTTDTDPSDQETGNDPGTWKTTKIDSQDDKAEIIPVPAIFLAVTAAAMALFVPLAKKRRSDSREENGTN